MARRKRGGRMGVPSFRAGEVQLPAARGGEQFREGMRMSGRKRGRGSRR